MKLLAFTFSLVVGVAITFGLPAAVQAQGKGGARAGAAAPRAASPAPAKANLNQSISKSTVNKGATVNKSVAANKGAVVNRAPVLNQTNNINRGGVGVGRPATAIIAGYGFADVGAGISVITPGLGPVYSGFDPYILQGFPNNIVGPIDYSVRSPGVAVNDVFAPNVRTATATTQTKQNQYFQQPSVEIGPKPMATTGTVVVVLPNETAELWFNGVKTQTGGQQRSFATPELMVGQKYTYEVRARWVANGKQFEQTRSVSVQAGAQSVVNFLQDSKELLPAPVGIKV